VSKGEKKIRWNGCKEIQITRHKEGAVDIYKFIKGGWMPSYLMLGTREAYQLQSSCRVKLKQGKGSLKLTGREKYQYRSHISCI
jgi:hypothetical protein